MNLANKVLIALVLGIIAGFLINASGAASIGWVDAYVVNGVFHVAGKLFFNALQMLVVPLVLFSLIPGIVGIGDIRLLGKVGTKSFALYIATTAIAISLGIALAVTFGIGQGMEIPVGDAFAGQAAARSFIEVLIGIVPKNIISAMANGEMLAIIFFAIFFGIALLIKINQSRELVNLIEQLNRVIMQMVEMVMWFAPYAVFCLVAKAVAELGFDIVVNLGGYFATVMLALILHAFVTQMAILKLFTGLSIRTFLSKIRAVQIFAFSTSSSGATIPVTLRTVQERLGIDRAVSSFTIPFGATINMDGTAIMQGVATVFVANLYGIELGVAGYVTIVLTAVLASIGTAAVPAVGLVMLTLVFKQVGLPIEAIGIILGIDRIVDMTRTAVNVTGDAVITTIVAKSENKMDLSVYNDPNAGEVHEVHIEDVTPSK
ncbi:dicarboxylate/amino acid:cation symporter [Arenicella xantha]|uniref:Na+/H+-dicarboxylate symporter n=1 Tax=Arenicella xantha TaxID=644221 RepID=A0A395JLZ2_9GAMM|nr:dicarboxylate/amino acid:cation symporter [Arenicella xantha]RBP51445.1 Na+/H+-dicarboxylate symporter [Arenicella xantha]